MSVLEEDAAGKVLAEVVYYEYHDDDVERVNLKRARKLWVEFLM